MIARCHRRPPSRPEKNRRSNHPPPSQPAKSGSLTVAARTLHLRPQISKVDKESINETIYAPQTRDLLRVQWNGDEYHLVSSTGFSARSSVTDCEDVSYVSSAYVPVCLRKGGLSV